MGYGNGLAGGQVSPAGCRFHWGARTRIRNAAGRQPSVDYVSGATRPAVSIEVINVKLPVAAQQAAAGGGNGGLVGAGAVAEP